MKETILQVDDLVTITEDIDYASVKKNTIGYINKVFDDGTVSFSPIDSDIETHLPNNNMLLMERKINGLLVQYITHYGCDICGERKLWDEDIMWITSWYGVCETCYAKMSEDERESIINMD